MLYSDLIKQAKTGNSFLDNSRVDVDAYRREYEKKYDPNAAAYRSGFVQGLGDYFKDPKQLAELGGRNTTTWAKNAVSKIPSFLPRLAGGIADLGRFAGNIGYNLYDIEKSYLTGTPYTGYKDVMAMDRPNFFTQAASGIDNTVGKWIRTGLNYADPVQWSNAFLDPNGKGWKDMNKPAEYTEDLQQAPGGKFIMNATEDAAADSAAISLLSRLLVPRLVSKRWKNIEKAEKESESMQRRIPIQDTAAAKSRIPIHIKETDRLEDSFRWPSSSKLTISKAHPDSHVSIGPFALYDETPSWTTQAGKDGIQYAVYNGNPCYYDGRLISKGYTIPVSEIESIDPLITGKPSFSLTTKNGLVSDTVAAHEYGHYLQYKNGMPVYNNRPTTFSDFLHPSRHPKIQYEISANALGGMASGIPNLGRLNRPALQSYIDALRYRYLYNNIIPNAGAAASTTQPVVSVPVDNQSGK